MPQTPKRASNGGSSASKEGRQSPLRYLKNFRDNDPLSNDRVRRISEDAGATDNKFECEPPSGHLCDSMLNTRRSSDPVQRQTFHSSHAAGNVSPTCTKSRCFDKERPAKQSCGHTRGRTMHRNLSSGDSEGRGVYPRSLASGRSKGRGVYPRSLTSDRSEGRGVCPLFPDHPDKRPRSRSSREYRRRKRSKSRRARSRSRRRRRRSRKKTRRRSRHRQYSVCSSSNASSRYQGITHNRLLEQILYEPPSKRKSNGKRTN